jgi:hypothetical protein
MSTPPLPAGYALDQNTSTPPLPQGYSLDVAGESTADVPGNKVITPAPGESFADTMRRAAAYGKTVTPGQVSAELQSAPKKAAIVGASALGAGFGGAAGLAGAGGAVEATLPKVLPATIQGVKAVGTWANNHPLQAYALYKILLEHSAITRLIKGIPEPTE